MDQQKEKEMRVKIFFLILIFLFLGSCDDGVENPHSPQTPDTQKTSVILTVTASIDVTEIGCALDNPPWTNFVTIEIYLNSTPVYSFELGKCYTTTTSNYESYTPDFELEVSKSYEVKFKLKEETYPVGAQIENIGFSLKVNIGAADTSFLIYRNRTHAQAENMDFSTEYFSGWNVGEFKSPYLPDFSVVKK